MSMEPKGTPSSHAGEPMGRRGPRSPVRALTVAGIALAIAVGALLLRPRGPRGVEWLTPANPMATGSCGTLIHEGAAYYLEMARDGTAMIYREDLLRGTRHRFATAAAGLSIAGCLQVCAPDLRYRVSRAGTNFVWSARAKAPVDPRSAMVARPGARFLGLYGPTGPRAVGSVPGRVVRAQIPPLVGQLPPAATRLMAMPLSGGRGRELVAVPGGELLVIEDRAYWLRARPDRSTMGRRGDLWWEELTGSSDIMETHLLRHSSRVLRSGVSQRTTLLCQDGSLSWTEPRPYPDDTQDLHVVRPNGQAVSIADYDGCYDRPPVAVAKQLYWPSYPGPSHWGGGKGREPAVIVTSRLDGSTRRVVATAPTGQVFAPWGSPLGGHIQRRRGALLVITSSAGATGLLDHRSDWTIQRLATGRPNGLAPLLKIPSSAHDLVLDGDYVYFVMPSQTKVGGADRPWFCRMRLPE